MSVAATISAVVFYLAIIILIRVNRKKLDFPAKLIAMYRTKIGIKTMHSWGTKAEKTVKVLGTIGIYVGFLGMAFILFMIAQGLFNLVAAPEAPATFAPVIPGVKIPGVDIFVPFWYGIIALFLTIVVHEFSHGVVANAYGLKVKHSGVGMMGPFPMAFVEPDEKRLVKAERKAQLAIYAAGPFSNILLTILLILLFGFLPLFVAAAGGTPSPGLEKFTRYTSIMNAYGMEQEIYHTTGLRIARIANESAAEAVGLPDNTTITIINGFDVEENEVLFNRELEGMGSMSAGDTITLGNENVTYTITTLPHPDDPERGWIGIAAYYQQVEVDPAALDKYGKAGIFIILVIIQQVFWLILLSSGIGLANLLPLGPVDGGRMLLTELERFLPKKRAKAIWGKVSLFVLISVGLLVFVPIIRNGIIPIIAKLFV